MKRTFRQPSSNVFLLHRKVCCWSSWTISLVSLSATSAWGTREVGEVGASIACIVATAQPMAITMTIDLTRSQEPASEKEGGGLTSRRTLVTGQCTRMATTAAIVPPAAKVRAHKLIFTTVHIFHTNQCLDAHCRRENLSTLHCRSYM